MGKRRVGLTLRENVYFFCPVPKTARNILFFATGEKGNRLEGSRNQSTFEGAVTEWAWALRLPRTAAAERHTKTRDRRAHHHESKIHRIFSGFLMRQYLLPTYVIGYCSLAVLYTWYPSWGTPPRNSHGRCSAAAEFTFSDRPGDAAIVVDYYVCGGSWFDYSSVTFLLHVRGSSL